MQQKRFNLYILLDLARGELEYNKGINDPTRSVDILKELLQENPSGTLIEMRIERDTGTACRCN